MQWKFFFGACFLTGAVLLPHAPPSSVLGGMAVAAVIQFTWVFTHRNRHQ